MIVIRLANDLPEKIREHVMQEMLEQLLFGKITDVDSIHFSAGTRTAILQSPRHHVPLIADIIDSAIRRN